MTIGLARRVLGRVRHRLARNRIRGGVYRFEPVGRCLCGATGGESHLGREEFGRRLDLLLCPRCGLGRLSPRLASEDLPRYYASDYRILLGNRINDAYFERGMRRGRRLIEHLLEHDALPPKGSAVLEVGTGPGGILGAFRDMSYQVAGSDLDPQCVALARSRGLSVVHGEMLNAPELAPAGLIVLSHLVEHLLDPFATLGSLVPYADENTVLYVEVPGLRTDNPGKNVPQLPHLYYYDLTTIQWLLGRVGWRLVHGDEQVRAILRRAEGVVQVDTSGNFERNAATLA